MIDIGYIAAFLTTISFLPQVIHTLKTRRTDDISLTMYLVLGVGMLFWIAYGFTIMNLPIIFANAIALTMVILIICVKVIC
jgi:MtN3 and saliva related transmembrane protein